MSKTGSDTTWPKFTRPVLGAVAIRRLRRAGGITPKLIMRDALKKHWPEYLMEAAELGIFRLP